jgi:hypothetical protein
MLLVNYEVELKKDWADYCMSKLFSPLLETMEKSISYLLEKLVHFHLNYQEESPLRNHLWR